MEKNKQSIQLSPELIGRDGHALGGPHLKLRGTQLRIEALHEGHALAVVPAVQQVQCGGGEDGAYCVHHAHQHGDEHGPGGLVAHTGVLLHLVAVLLQATNLLCRKDHWIFVRRSSKEKEYEG